MKKLNQNLVINNLLVEASVDRWWHLLNCLVEVDSETRNVSGVNRIQAHLEKALLTLGARVDRINNPEGNEVSGDLLIGEIEGMTDRFITLVCHADTVFGAAQIEHRITWQGARAYAPGIIDNKGGIVVALQGLEKYLQKKKFRPKYGIRFISSPNEELGSVGFHKIFQNFSKDSIVVLGFEPALTNGDIIYGRKGNRWYDIKVIGKGAHSGRAHHLGANACSELAIQLAKIQELTDYEREVTVNIGRIEGGNKHNVVSDYAFGQLELRYPCHVTRNMLIKEVEANLSRNHISCHKNISSTEIDYQVVDDCLSFSPNQESFCVFEKYQEIITAIEKRSIQAKKVGGAADANHFSEPGKIILDGLGPVGGGMHTPNEYLEVESLSTRSEALSMLLEEIQTGGIESVRNQSI